VQSGKYYLLLGNGHIYSNELSLHFRLNNLSIANRIYLLEPQWNPSVESQAIGRIFRLGQERPVTVIRYIMDETIEEVGFDLETLVISIN
jgi:hypothetical protein